MGTESDNVENKLDSEVREYLDDHAVMAGVSTVYTLGIQTLRRDTNKILAFMSKVTPAGAYVNYNAYASGQLERHEGNFKIKDEDKHRASLKVFVKESFDAPLKLENKRYF